MSPQIALVRDYSYGMGQPCLFAFDLFRSPADQMDDLVLGRLHDTTTRITFAPTRAAWQLAYRIARTLAIQGAVSIQQPDDEEAKVEIDLGRRHTVSLIYRCTRPLPAEGAR